MRYAPLAWLVWLCSLWSASILACGVCIDDKVASTYDHDVVMRATARSHVVVFGEVEGSADMQKVTAAIAVAAGRTAGIDYGTVRTSSAPAAFSFSLNPAAQTPQAAVAQIQQRLRTRGVQLSILRVVTRQSLLPGKTSN